MARSKEAMYDPPLSRSRSRSRTSSLSSSTRSPPQEPLNPSPPTHSASTRPRTSSRSRSIPQRLESAFSDFEHFAQTVEAGAQEVEHFGKTGREVLETVEREYPGLGKDAGKERDGRKERKVEGSSTEVEDGSAQEEDETDDDDEKNMKRPLLDEKEAMPRVVPYSRPSTAKKEIGKGGTTNEKPRKDTIDSFRTDLDSTQDRIDDLYLLLETIALERSQLTRTPYSFRPTTNTSSKSPSNTMNKPDSERRKKIVSDVSFAKQDLLSLYQEISNDLTLRYNQLLPELSRSKKPDKKEKKLLRKYATMNSSFAKLLDFVEDRAKEESGEGVEGHRESRFMERSKEEEPGMDESQRLRSLKRVKEESRKRKSFDGIDPESSTGKWMIENPFTELDWTALQEIDLLETQKASAPPRSSSPRSSKENSPGWAVPTWIHNVLNLTSSSQKRDSRTTPTRSHVPSPSMLEMGHSTSSRKRSSRRQKRTTTTRSYDLSHSSSHSRSYDVSLSEESSVEAQLRGQIPVKKTQSEIELDSTEIPYQVPNDDTSGYQETKEELREDQRMRIESEHFWTPIVVVEWSLILVMIFYYIITRAIGYSNPLGDLKLYKVVGNDQWSDRNPNSVDVTLEGGGRSNSTKEVTSSSSSTTRNLFSSGTAGASTMTESQSSNSARTTSDSTSNLVPSRTPLGAQSEPTVTSSPTTMTMTRSPLDSLDSVD
ncbi:hypothetical protein JCM16303_004601 [Sporobolomyces ruberrimus]